MLTSKIPQIQSGWKMERELAQKYHKSFVLCLTYTELSPDCLHSRLVSVADNLTGIILSVFILAWSELVLWLFLSQKVDIDCQ